jgi:tripartite-type tricarboxylate transporter receptor subunit TctC
MERSLSVVFVSVIFLSTNTTSAIAADYPAKPIQMFVGYTAGGLADSMARALAKPMEEVLAQPVVILNKPGAGGAIAMTALKTSKPDGYTIGVTTSITFTYSPHVQKVDYSLDDFKFIAAVGQYQEAYVSSPDRPWKDFKELVQYSKKNPGLSFASMHPIGENILNYVSKKEGIEWRAIPTKGGEEVMTAVLGKHVDFGFSGGIHISFVKAGKMIVLAGLGKRRLLASPGVPTLKEVGYDISFENYNIVAFPKGVPDPIVKKLSEAVAKAARDPKYVDLLENKFFIPAVYMAGEELDKSMRDQFEFHQKMIQTLQK